MKKIKLVALLVVMIFSITSYGKIKNLKTETYKVFGNCGTCKKKIEKAVSLNKDAKGLWNKDTKMLTLTYDSKKTNADEVLKRIADAGYDNDKFIANNAVYNTLDACCQYSRKPVDKTPVVLAAVPKVIPTPKMVDVPMTTEMKDAQKVISAPMETTSAPKTEITNTKSDFHAMLTQYYGLKNALTSDNGTLAAKNASALIIEINAIKMESMSVDEHTVWMKYLEKLKTDATKISTAKEIEKQRTAFTSLSNNLWLTVKGLKIKDNGAIYVEYCPMKDAYWLSKESSIKNPYFGKQMLTCGSIKETIK